MREWNVAFADYIAEHHPDWPERFESEAAAPWAATPTPPVSRIARAWVKAI